MAFSSRIDEVVNNLSKITATREMGEPDEVSAYGLDEPNYTIILEKSNGDEFKVEIGDTASNSDYYMTIDGGETVYTIDTSIPDSLNFDEMYYLETEDFPDIDSSTLTQLTVTENESQILSCSSKDEEDEEALITYGNELSYIELDDCVNYNATSDEVTDYGLDDVNCTTVKITYTEDDESKTETFYLGETYTENDDTFIYLQLKNSNMVYKIDTSFLEELLKY